ncbi:type II toxin-antitoxin system Phd/YefM family antitoxin [Arthrospira platensis SPKY1]|nr:type II toxin-antitoxin system Phd/YefM family antitoxin [Arthrospira platensis SPKY1]
MSIHPQVIEKEGKKEFVILPYDEFLAIKESLEDYEDLKDLREAKVEEAHSPTVSWSSAKSQLLGDK